MKQSRKPFQGIYYLSGMKGFHIVVRLKDVPGALHSALGELSECVDIVNSVSYGLEDGTAIWSGFVKSLSTSETDGSLKKRIELSPSVLECEVKESDHGLLIDSFHSGFDIGHDIPGIVFSVAGFARVCDRLAQLLGSGGQTILFQEGLAFGKSTGQYLNARLGQGDLEWKVKALVGMNRAHGWGTASLEVVEPGARFRVTTVDDLECAELGKGRKGCDFLRGHLTSAISALSGSEFEGEETKCKLRGDKFCEFLLSRMETQGT